MTFSLTESLHADFSEVYTMYEQRRRGDEEAFQGLFKRAIQAIHSTPRLHSLVDDEYPGREVREYFIKRFGQRILYSIEGETLVVFAIVHATRRPSAWHRRLDTFQ